MWSWFGGKKGSAKPEEKKTKRVSGTQSEKKAEASDPNVQWALRKAKIEAQGSAQPKYPIVSDPASQPTPEGHLRFVCISDTHSLHSFIKDMPAGDVLIHAGDFSNIGLPHDITALSEWLGGLPFRHKVVIAGNHDLTFDPDSYGTTGVRFGHQERYDCAEVKASLQNCTYLEDELVEIEGIRIYGSPWQPEFCDWAFNLPRGEPCLEIWKMIPSEVDVLITHGPPLGHGDLCTHGGRAGCVDLLDEVESRIKPRYHVFGHIHEGYGATTNGETTFINASSCNYRYDRHNLNPPIVFDVPTKRHHSQDDDEGEDGGEEEPTS